MTSLPSGENFGSCTNLKLCRSSGTMALSDSTSLHLKLLRDMRYHYQAVRIIVQSKLTTEILIFGSKKVLY